MLQAKAQDDIGSIQFDNDTRMTSKGKTLTFHIEKHFLGNYKNCYSSSQTAASIWRVSFNLSGDTLHLAIYFRSPGADGIVSTDL